jgi:DDE superfamily endonuclease
MNKTRLFKNLRLCKALTGLTPVEIENLLPAFGSSLIAQSYELRPIQQRKRKFGGGQKGSLPTVMDKLLFILIYLKIYPTFDVMGFLTSRQASKCQYSVAQLLPVLEKALQRHIALPKRKISTPEEFFRAYPQARDVFIDGTERKTQKPKKIKRRNKLYSGKKKMTSRKTIVVCDERRKILLLTPTKSGRRHDKKIADKFRIIENIPSTVCVWADTGFQGVQRAHPNSIIPKKSTKNKPLNHAEKAENRLISGIRVLAEHAIGGMKRFKAAADIYRNRLPNLDDHFNLLAAGLWNYHLQMA